MAKQSRTSQNRALAALRVGFLTRAIRHLMESLFADDVMQVKDVDGTLLGIREGLQTLAKTTSRFQNKHFEDLAAKIEERHEEANWHIREVLDRASAPRKQALAQAEPLLRTWRLWQKQDQQELKRLTGLAVEGDDRLTLWYAIAFTLADLIFRIEAGQLSAPLREKDVALLFKRVEALYDEEKVWVCECFEDELEQSGGAYTAEMLREAYRGLQGFLKEVHDRGIEFFEGYEEFRHNSDFTVCRWRGKEYRFPRGLAGFVQLLYRDWKRCGVGLSVADLYKRVGRKTHPKTRPEEVFRVRRGKLMFHPAWTDGLIQKVSSRVVRLNLPARSHM